MSTTSTTASPDTTITPLAGFAAALDTAVAVVWGIDAGQAQLPTPCEQYDVQALVGHLFGAVRRAGGLAHGEFGGELDESVGTDGTWADQLRVAADSALAEWRTADLEADRVLPWATLPGAGVLWMYAMEVLAHTWDLAVATRQPSEFDPALGETVLAWAHTFLPDEMPRGAAQGVPFEAVQPVGADAGPYARLAAFLGRTV